MTSNHHDRLTDRNEENLRNLCRTRLISVEQLQLLRDDQDERR